MSGAIVMDRGKVGTSIWIDGWTPGPLQQGARSSHDSYVANSFFDSPITNNQVSLT